MLTIKTNALTEKAVLRPAVRKTIRENITSVTITLANGSIVELENKGNGDYFGVIASADDTNINAKVELTITTNTINNSFWISCSTAHTGHLLSINQYQK
jgi:hypothetical protein